MRQEARKSARERTNKVSTKSQNDQRGAQRCPSAHTGLLKSFQERPKTPSTELASEIDRDFLEIP